MPERTITQEIVQVVSASRGSGRNIEQVNSINSVATVFVDASTSLWSGTETPDNNPALELSFDSDFSLSLSSDSLGNSWNCSSLSVKPRESRT